MKSHNVVFLFLLFSVITEGQAQQSHDRLPQCSDTAPEVAIQVIAGPAPYKIVIAIAAGAAFGVAAGAAARAGARAVAGNVNEPAYINIFLIAWGQH